MPIIRTYACGSCNFMMEVSLRADQWDAEPPECPQCAQHTRQEFHPIAIGGSNRAKAVKIAEDIAEHDYGVADFKAEGREGGRATVRYKDQTINGVAPSHWNSLAGNADFQKAMALGRDTRIRFGDGLEILQKNLKDGTQPDLIEASKRRSMKVW
jgi:hypothetical protein